MLVPRGLGPFLLISLTTELAAAQVNVEPLRRQLERQGMTANARFSLVGRTGNSEGLEVGAGTLLGLGTGRSLVYLSASGSYAEYAGETQVQKAFAHLRYNYQSSSTVAAELFAQIEADRFRRLESRTLFGAGPRFTLLSTDEAHLHFGTSAMLELTRRNDSVPAAQRDRKNLRWNNYVAFTLELHDRVNLTETAYYQPRFDDFGDFWFLNVSSAQFQVTDRLASRLDFTLRREAVVPPDVKNVDSEVSSSLELKF